MHPLRASLVIGLVTLVSACFVSQTPFIADSEVTRLGQGTILVCSDASDCAQAIPNQENNGYQMMPPPGENDPPMPIRFASLMDTANGPVWLAEIDMTEEDEQAFVVGVVRRAPEYDAGGVAAYDIKLPWCDDVSEEEAQAYGIERLDSYTCALPEKTSMSEYLRQTHREKFETPQWWADD